jgi:hypothetical protein
VLLALWESPKLPDKGHMLIMEEEVDEDKHRPGRGLPLPYLVLLEPGDDIMIDDIKRMVDEAATFNTSTKELVIGSPCPLRSEVQSEVLLLTPHRSGYQFNQLLISLNTLD